MRIDGTRTIAWLRCALVCGALSACAPSPHVQLTRQVERAASWASAAEFGAETTRAGRTPQAYARDLYRRGADDVVEMARAIEKIDADPDERVAAVRACRRLADSLRASVSGDPDGPAFAEACRELQRLAARSGAVQAAPR